MIKAFDSVRGYESHAEEFAAAIERVLRSGQLILGPELRAFEREFAAFVGASEAVGVASGTDALELALLALDIGPGDEVITVANTAIPTAAAIHSVGAIPKFVDVDARTLLMNPDLVETALTSRTRCLLPVHLHGHPVAMAGLLEIAARHDLRVIEDCAHAHGTRLDGRHVGTFGDIGCFSFYPTKNLGAFGDAGLCVTTSTRVAQRLRTLRAYGCDEHRVAQTYGRNSRLDELQAAILRVKLAHLPTALAARQRIVARYREGLADAECTLPAASTAGEHAYHQFVIRCRDRAALITALDSAAIGYGIHYPRPLHQMPAFRRDQDAPMLPVTEAAADQILSLPLYPELRTDEIERVIATVKAGLDSGRPHA